MKPKQILKTMNVITWIIFIGLCIKSGAIIISFFVSLFLNEQAAKNLYLGLDMSSLYEFNLTDFIIIMTLIIVISVLKAYLFYIVIKIFKSINYDKPFNTIVSQLVSKISRFAFITGLFALTGSVYSLWLINKSIFLPINWGTSELLFMAGVIYIISFLFQRAVQIQTENDLTI